MSAETETLPKKNSGEEPAKPRAAQPAASPQSLLLLWQIDEQVEVVGHLGATGFRRSWKIPQKELEALLPEGSEYKGVSQGKTLSPLRWVCDRFLATAPSKKDGLVTVGTWKSEIEAPKTPPATAELTKRAQAVLKKERLSTNMEIHSVYEADVDGDGASEYFVGVEEATMNPRIYDSANGGRKTDFMGIIVLPGSGEAFFHGEHGADSDFFASVSLNALLDIDGDGKKELFIETDFINGGARIDIVDLEDNALVERIQLGGWGETDCDDKPWTNWGMDQE